MARRLGTSFWRTATGAAYAQGGWEPPCDLESATIRIDYRDGMFLILVLPPRREPS